MRGLVLFEGRNKQNQIIGFTGERISACYRANHPIAERLQKNHIDAVIATNTTISREGVERYTQSNETGGLSGAPLRVKSTTVIKKLSLALQKTIPIIGVGGIMI